MAKGDITISFTSTDGTPNPEIRALMPDYQASSTDRIEALNQGSRFMMLSRQANAEADKLGAAHVMVEGNLGTALASAYDQKLHTVEITHTTDSGMLGIGTKSDVLYKGAITPELADRLEKAVGTIGKQLETLAVHCEKGTFTTSQCEEMKQTVPSTIISEALGNTR